MDYLNVKEEFTVKQVFDALAKDGFEHLRGQWFAEDVHGVIVGACILGQGALNLGVDGNGSDDALVYQLDKFRIFNFNIIGPYFGFSNEDSFNENNKAHTGDEPYYSLGAGSAIIWWNDREDPTKESGYFLETYKEVIEKAREILEPFFDETVVLATRNWSFKKLVGSVND